MRGPLRHGQRRMQDHPVQQVRELADAAADPRLGLAVRQPHAFQITLAAGRVADDLVERERLAGADQQAVDLCAGELQVRDLVVLHPHLGLAELSQQQRLVPLDPHRQVFHVVRCGVRRAGRHPVQALHGAVVTNGQRVQQTHPLTPAPPPYRRENARLLGHTQLPHTDLPRRRRGCALRHPRSPEPRRPRPPYAAGTPTT